MNYKLSKLAKEDFISIASYSVKNWGDAAAKRYITSLDDCFAQLGENPQLGKSRNAIKSGYFSFNAGSHVIFYKLDRNLCTNACT